MVIIRFIITLGMVLKKISSVFTESQKFIDVRPKLRIYSSVSGASKEIKGQIQTRDPVPLQTISVCLSVCPKKIFH